MKFDIKRLLVERNTIKLWILKDKITTKFKPWLQGFSKTVHVLQEKYFVVEKHETFIWLFFPLKDNLEFSMEINDDLNTTRGRA